jgi:hypothetical protein
MHRIKYKVKCVYQVMQKVPAMCYRQTISDAISLLAAVAAGRYHTPTWPFAHCRYGSLTMTNTTACGAQHSLTGATGATGATGFGVTGARSIQARNIRDALFSRYFSIIIIFTACPFAKVFLQTSCSLNHQVSSRGTTSLFPLSFLLCVRT